MSKYKRFQVTQQGDVTVVQLLDKELSDLLLQDEFFQEVMSLIADQQPKKLLVDFNVCDYCTTGIINTLISAKKRVLDYQGDMRLCGLGPNVQAAFRALNLEGTVFQVSATIGEGVAAFEG